MTRSSLFNAKTGAARNTMASFLTRRNLGADPKGEVWEVYKSLPPLLDLVPGVFERQAFVLDHYGLCGQSFRASSGSGFGGCDVEK